MAAKWGFLTNHAVAFILISQNTRITTREIAEGLQLTERSVHRIISDLEDAGYIRRHKEGRSNRYEVNTEQPTRHVSLKAVPMADLLQIFISENGSPRTSK